MKNSLVAEVSVMIDAPPALVWEALTTPSMVKKYLMDTNVTTDWKEGSPITYDGEYNGKKYHDKGTIKKVIPEQLLQYTYLSSMSGKADTPENYNLVSFELVATEDKTQLKLTQDNIATEEERAHSSANWKNVLTKLKELVETAS